MKILVIIPILPRNGEVELRVSERAKEYVKPDTEVHSVNIMYGPASIESLYDDTMAAPFARAHKLERLRYISNIVRGLYWA